MSMDIFTDGSYMGEDKCGYGIYFPNAEYKNISKKFTKPPLTNNRAELYAIYKALKIIQRMKFVGEAIIYTDSKYCMNSITLWYDTWIKTGKEYKNKDLLDRIMKNMKKMNNVQFKHVRAHSGKKDYFSISNDHADNLAKKGALM